MRALVCAVLTTLALGALSLVVVPPSQAAVTNYYVSAGKDGSDSNAGTSADKPLASLAALNKKALKAGDVVNLDASSTWLGPLRVTASGTASAPITVQSWRGSTSTAPTITGQNSADCVVVTGSYVTISGVKAYQCGYAGISLAGSHDTVSGSTATGNIAGVHVEATSTYATVQNSYLLGNNRLVSGTTGTDDDSGAFGVLVNGDNALVQNNVMNGNYAYSQDYGNDGSAVEVYAAVGTRILRNHGDSNAAFVELGSSSTKVAADTTIAYNDATGATAATSRADDVDTFVVTRGAGSFGPVNNTVVAHNSVYLTNPNSAGVVCISCSAKILTLEGNAVRTVAKSIYADGPYAGGWNFFVGDQFQATSPATSDQRVDPKFTSTTDLRLQATSPAIDYAPATTYTRDIDGVVVPRDGNNDGRAAPDSGAHER